MTDKGFRSKKIRQFTSRLSFRIICGTVFLLLFFGALQSVVGYAEFTRSLTNEYKEAAFRTADTAAYLIDGNRIDEYIERLYLKAMFMVKNSLDKLMDSNYTMLPDTNFLMYLVVVLLMHYMLKW